MRLRSASYQTVVGGENLCRDVHVLRLVEMESLREAKQQGENGERRSGLHDASVCGGDLDAPSA